MKLEDVQDKIDKYFEALTPEQTVKLFESWGYELEYYQEIQDLTPVEKIKRVQDDFINKNNDPNSFIGCLGSKEWFDYLRFTFFLFEISPPLKYFSITQTLENLGNSTKIATTALERAFEDLGIISEKKFIDDLIFSQTPKIPKIWKQKNKREMYKRGRK